MPLTEKAGIMLQLAFACAPAFLAFANSSLDSLSHFPARWTQLSALPNVCLSFLKSPLLIYRRIHRRFAATRTGILNVFVFRRRRVKDAGLLAAF
jgi:hypothetical protein